MVGKEIILYEFIVLAREGKITISNQGKGMIFEYDSTRAYRVYRHNTGDGTVNIPEEGLEELQVSFYLAGKNSVSGEVYIPENRLQHKERILANVEKEMGYRCRDHFGRW